MGSDDHVTRGAAFALRGLAAWSAGDLDSAHASYSACLPEFERADHVSDVLGCSVVLGDIEVVQGHPRQAVRTYRSALDLADRHHAPVLRGRADMHVGLAARHLEADDLSAARRELARSRELGDHAGLPQEAYRWRLVMAGVREAEGDVEAAIDLLDEADRLYVGDFHPPVRPIPAVRARTWARHGYVDAALEWADQADVSVGRPPDLPAGVRAPHPRQGAGSPTRHVGAGEGTSRPRCRSSTACWPPRRRGARGGSVIEIQLTRALVLHAGRRPRRGGGVAGRRPRARRTGGLHPHVRPARGRRWPPCSRPRRSGRPRRTSVASARRAGPDRGTSSAPRRTDGSHGTPVDALSSRERDVLRLLGTELSGPEIARELVVSLNTVRTHTKNVYMKLGVTSRRAAVARAKELDLL